MDRGLRTIGRPDLERFFRRVDERLTDPCTLVVVGGTVASLLVHEHLIYSQDVDVWSSHDEFWASCEALAKDERWLPVNRATLVQAPDDFEDRIQPFELPGLLHLTVALPDVHDWAIMKLARGTEHDFEHIEAVHRAHPLDADTLLERFLRTHFLGVRRTHELTLLLLVERLSGPQEAERIEALLRA